MNTNVAGTLSRGYLDPLFLGATGGTIVGIFFGRPVEGCLAGVSLGYSLSECSSHSSGDDGDSGRRPEHDSGSEEPTDSGQCARSLPYMRSQPALHAPRSGSVARWSAG